MANFKFQMVVDLLKEWIDDGDVSCEEIANLYWLLEQALPDAVHLWDIDMRDDEN